MFSASHTIHHNVSPYAASNAVWAEWQQHVISLGDVVSSMGPWACTPDYLLWFYCISHPYAILLEEGEPPRPLVHLLPIPVQFLPEQPLIEYVPDGDYSCQDRFQMMSGSMHNLLDLRVVP
ncbi:hypothetical protein AAZV13_18G156100 [Glycine max]